MLESDEEIFVKFLGLFPHLSLEGLTLEKRIVLLRVGRCDLLSVYAELEDVDGGGIVLGDLCKRAKLPWNVGNESGLHKGMLDDFLKNIVGDLEVLQVGIDFYPKFPCFLELRLLGQLEPIIASSCIQYQVLLLGFSPFS